MPPTSGNEDSLERELRDALSDAEKTQSTPARRPAPFASRPEHPERVGHYRILEPLGEGGMGTVYLAEQTEPVRHRVALKLIKLGMDTKQVIARFESERQALAMMNHPGIAAVYDAGVSEEGRPYFVMEYVAGMPITEFCDKHRLSIGERLGLFMQVCDAVQHAHQKGIIHRDIKPSNVLVAYQGEKPAPKIIDFGVAKAVNQRLTEKTLFTEHGQIIGTPEYMSPEQAEMSNIDIDTRTDIYSLGVMLYELLVGALPFASKELRSAGYAAIQRMIREVEPPRPSTRLSAMGEDSGPVANRRRTDLLALQRELRGDLDWITMKALDKDRTRRYASATEFAADLTRYLGHEPVLARPPSTGYRLRKFVRKHRGGVFAGAAVLLALVAGLAGTLWQRDAARAAEAEQRRLAESEWAARMEADIKRVEAEQARNRAEAINAIVTKALQSSDPFKGGKQDTLVTDAMMMVLKELDAGAFRDDPETEAGLRVTIAVILANNGRAVEAEPLMVHALEMRQRLFEGDHPDVAASLSHLAGVRQLLGRAAEAEPLLVQALEMRQRLFKRDHPDVAASLNNLAGVQKSLGRAAEAEPLVVQALEMRQRLFKGDHPDVAGGLYNLAGVLTELGRPQEAVTRADAAVGMVRRLYPAGHPLLARALCGAGSARLAAGQAGEALPLIEESVAMAEKLLPLEHPHVTQYRETLARCREALGP